MEGGRGWWRVRERKRERESKERERAKERVGKEGEGERKRYCSCLGVDYNRDTKQCYYLDINEKKTIR